MRAPRLALLLALPALGLGVGLWAGARRQQRLPDLAPHAAAIDAAAREQGVDPALVRAVVAAESGGDAAARSGAGALGLMQLMPDATRDAARRLGIAPPPPEALTTDPALNVRLGTAYLKLLLERFGGEDAFAVAAYHAGAARVEGWRERALDLDALGVIAREGGPQTREYVPRVLAFRDAYRSR